MVFVIAQRLQAQDVPRERLLHVLNDIISVLISSELIAELTKPQPPLSHKAARVIIEDITQSSVMRLDSSSMSKLWDLITMVFKWQVTVSADLMGLTLRHLYEIETYLINPDTHLQLHKVQNVIENFNKILGKKEKEEIRGIVLSWLDNFNIKVSLLLRLGLQNEDGTFILTDHDFVAQEMLKNLGENIFEVTQNGKILQQEVGKEEENETCELQGFAEEILGKRKLNYESGSMRLVINDLDKQQRGEIQLELMDNIVSKHDSTLEKIIKDLDMCNVIEQSSVHDDLLDIMETETE
ncbi:hypothetical protein FQA39_LY10206 [Lamprigera yunnana]|nr:hypothetical protein FQA39_LY10206 [Lamprigera yunnana]